MSAGLSKGGPWPGNGWQQCINTAGCPEFDQGRFTDFYKRTMSALRQSDPRHLIFYEPAVTWKPSDRAGYVVEPKTGIRTFNVNKRYGESVLRGH